MDVKISRITIKNFKNLKDVTIRPKKFNVLIGPNGSGKTNFLEFFKLLRKIYVERNPYPFLEWDGYENAVWNHKTDLPIEFEIETVERTNLKNFVNKDLSKKIKHEEDIPLEIFRRISASFWTDKMENLKILKEIVEIEIPRLDFRFSIEESGDTRKVKLNEEEYELDFILEHPDIFKQSIFKDSKEIILHFLSEYVSEYIFKKIFKEAGILEKILESRFESKISKMSLPFIKLLRMVTLFSLNISEIKYKRNINPIEETISERGENILDILFSIQLRDGMLPDKIEYAADTYFNGRLYFKNRNLYLFDINKKVEFSKEHLPDGLIKTIVILTALEQNPSILLIDEIENSLHPELIEFLIAMLREESKGCVFVTTHSPIVLNLVEPEEIWIFKPNDEGVEIKNVTEYKSKEELMKELDELGITLGEKVFYGLT